MPNEAYKRRMEARYSPQGARLTPLGYMDRKWL